MWTTVWSLSLPLHGSGNKRHLHIVQETGKRNGLMVSVFRKLGPTEALHLLFLVLAPSSGEGKYQTHCSFVHQKPPFPLLHQISCALLLFSSTLLLPSSVCTPFSKESPLSHFPGQVTCTPLLPFLLFPKTPFLATVHFAFLASVSRLCTHIWRFGVRSLWYEREHMLVFLPSPLFFFHLFWGNV